MTVLSRQGQEVNVLSHQGQELSRMIIWSVLPRFLSVESNELKKVTGVQHTHTHMFNGPLSGTNWVSRYQKGKTNLDFTEAKRWWVAVVSAGPYASLHLAPDR